jgi:hypothetical protein
MENKFEALVNKIKGERNISEFKYLDNNDILTEVILDDEYNHDMINYSYLVDFYNDNIAKYNISIKNNNDNKNRIYEFTLVLQEKLNIQCSDDTFPICQKGQNNDLATCNTKEKIKEILKRNLFKVSFKDIYEFVHPTTKGGKSKSNKRKKTKARKTNKRKKTKSKTNKRKKRTRRRR